MNRGITRIGSSISVVFKSKIHGGDFQTNARVGLVRNATQSLANNTLTEIIWDQVLYEAGADLWTPGNPSWLVPIPFGSWLVVGFLEFAAGTTGEREAWVRVRDQANALVDNIGKASIPTLGGATPSLVNFSCLSFNNNGNNHFTIEGKHLQGVALNINHARVHMIQLSRWD